MTSESPFAFALTGAAFGQCFLLIALLCARRINAGKPWPLDQAALCGFFLVEFVLLSIELVVEGLGYGDSAAWTLMTAPLVPLLPILAWLYIRGLTEPQAAIGQRYWHYLVPSGMTFACYLPLVLFEEVWQQAGHLDDAPTEVVIVAMIVLIGVLAATMLWVSILIIVAVKAFKRLRHHQRNIRQLYSDLEGKRLSGLDILLWIVLVAVGISLADEVSMMFFDFDLLNDITGPLYELALVSAFGFFGLLYTPPLAPWTGPALAEPPAEPPEPAAPRQANSSPRYARSALTEEDCTRIMDKVTHAMQRDKLWQDHFLSLKDLAEITGASPNHISQTLNSHLGKNFYDFINGHRIEEAQALLSSTEDTVLAISETVGFNSKSTFNAAFRKLTGMTPTQYRTRQRQAA